jgi:hypothetical protein
VTAVTRSAPGRVELPMADDVASMVTFVDLARREKTGCGFFTFTVEIDDRGTTLVVEVPDEAIGVLDDFAGLAEQHE